MSSSKEIDHHRKKTIDTDYLMSDMLMKNEYTDIWYAGLVPCVPVEVDVTNRTDVLRIIDRGKKQELIPLQLTQDPDAIFSLSRNDIKISKQNSEEDNLLQVPIHEIAAVCYIKDDGLHILAMKYGNPDKCDFAVLYCKSQSQADSICASIGQCFQMAYQDATMRLLQQTINDASRVSITSSSDSGTINTDSQQEVPSFFSKSDQELNEPRQHRTPSVGEKSETGSSRHALLVKEYMKELPKFFTVEELLQFSKLFQALNDPLNADIADICDEIYILYGPERKHLIRGLCPFIPSKHYQYFERYLKEKDLDTSENGHSTLSSRHSYNGIYTRSQSDVSTMNSSDVSTMNGSDLDHVLERLSVELEKMDASVGDVNNPYIYSNSNDVG